MARGVGAYRYRHVLDVVQWSVLVMAGGLGEEGWDVSAGVVQSICTPEGDAGTRSHLCS
jgi:hypothetical protein